MANTKATFFIEKLDKRALEALFRAKRRLTFGKKSIRNRSLYISFLFISQLIYVAEFISFAFLLTDFVNKLHFLKIKIPEHFAKY